MVNLISLAETYLVDTWGPLCGSRLKFWTPTKVKIKKNIDACIEYCTVSHWIALSDWIIDSKAIIIISIILSFSLFYIYILNQENNIYYNI